MKAPFPLAPLTKSFINLYQGGLDDLHFISRGLTLVIWKAFTTTVYLNPLAPKSPRSVGDISFTNTIPLHHLFYPFSLSIEGGQDLLTFVNKEIDDTRRYIPPYFSGSYNKMSSGYRAGNILCHLNCYILIILFIFV